MAYTKQTWQDLPSKTTPINASRLGHIEQGIYDAASTADTAASNASSALSGLDDKVDKVTGKGLSTNDFTDALQTKLSNIAEGAEVNVQSDWNQSDNSADDYIKNKPSLGTSAYKNSTSVVTDSTDLVESGAVYDALGFGNKNLLPTSLFTDTEYFTINADGSITALKSDTRPYANVPKSFLLKKGTYFYGKDNSSRMLVYDVDNSRALVDTSSESATFTLNADTNVKVKISASGTYPQTIKAIICNNNLTDKSWVPYHASVEESLAEKCDNSVIGTVEDGSTASQAYAVGSHFIRDGAFCTVTTAISSGESLVGSSKFTSGDVADKLTNKVTEVTTNNPNITLHTTYRKVVRYGNVVQFKVRITLASPLEGGSDVTLFNIGYVPVFNYIRAYVYEANAEETDLGNICSIASGGRITTKYALQASTYNVEGVVIVQ